MLSETFTAVRRVVVFVVGVSIVVIGVVMLVTPGPAVLVIPAGLAVLATEFPWARRLLRRVKTAITRERTGAARRREAEPGNDSLRGRDDDARPGG